MKTCDKCTHKEHCEPAETHPEKGCVQFKLDVLKVVRG
jgi:hypothetical protein